MYQMSSPIRMGLVYQVEACNTFSPSPSDKTCIWTALKEPQGFENANKTITQYTLSCDEAKERRLTVATSHIGESLLSRRY